MISKSIQLISICYTVNCKVYILEDLHPLVGKNVLNIVTYSKTIINACCIKMYISFRLS